MQNPRPNVVTAAASGIPARFAEFGLTNREAFIALAIVLSVIIRQSPAENHAELVEYQNQLLTYFLSAQDSSDIPDFYPEEWDGCDDS